jgi:hypothetical protein
MKPTKEEKKSDKTTVHSGKLNGFHIDSDKQVRLGFGLLEHGIQHLFIFDADADTLDQIVEVVNDTRKALKEKGGEINKEPRKTKSAKVEKAKAK